jgi:hypothetical protein
MNDIPTPRTDALMPTQENGRTLYDHVQVMEIHARQLEREFAEVTKQRDALVGALEYVANSGLSARHLVDFAQEALAATKGGEA